MNGKNQCWKILGVTAGLALLSPGRGLEAANQNRISPDDAVELSRATIVAANEMSLHMDEARRANSAKDYKQAAQDLTQLRNQLTAQITALQAAAANLDQTAKELPQGSVTDQQLAQVFNTVQNASDRTRTWVPIASNEVDVVMPEVDFHLVRAERENQLGQNKNAAKDLRTAISYLAMRDNNMPPNSGEKMREALKDAERKLGTIATDLQNGKKVDAKRLRKATDQADAAWQAVKGA